ncbi:PTS sugar transporter subunit IIB [Pediococcus acidilactici]|uniref:PTS system sorbose subfamily IIB component n=1 Tax=Pediococcus acidilactici DSM 20284 TaxID=862514 RepID=E0NHN0_PEDAC|nr:PTS sugar transporter subunit IIB [Pediococcus acidilactici]AZP90308.1 PTS mannose/fructose/sorbose transporter subunit IIB [Pediococcus acidilactici]EFL95047.1 PTS system sorbose subfamily IIB component [Pediococcus acidilactici DSM 20284]MDG9740264.1 PTS sugar transporter subunit IIB [Pediococcus acidilactici]NKZ17126.1 PTS sugar transporter subunit IIB [Pediococcus acidilactici]QQT95755.1 PTS sugar transporter subunit IIB [Pediococcus acidilactici]
MIKLVRVDHRLLHGQVAFAWIKYLKVDCVLIANDEVANDSLRTAALRMARPDNVKLVIKGSDESIEALNSGITDKYNLLILLENVKDACELAEKVTAIKVVNLGGAKDGEGKRQVAKAFFVNNQEINIMKRAAEKVGTRFEVQMVPNDKVQDVFKLIGE